MEHESIVSNFMGRGEVPRFSDRLRGGVCGKTPCPVRKDKQPSPIRDGRRFRANEAAEARRAVLYLEYTPSRITPCPQTPPDLNASSVVTVAFLPSKTIVTFTALS